MEDGLPGREVTKVVTTDGDRFCPLRIYICWDPFQKGLELHGFFLTGGWSDHHLRLSPSWDDPSSELEGAGEMGNDSTNCLEW